MGRGGRRNRPDVPERTCIASGDKLPQPELIRFVLDSGGRVTPDADGKLPGRGIWVRAERGAIERACAARLFSRAARRQAEVPENLLTDIESSLVRRVSGLLALARKSGAAVSGFERVRDTLNNGDAGLLLQASDGSPRQGAKLAGRAGDAELFRCLTAAELGVAFGRQNVIHAAVRVGGLAERVRVEARRLVGIRCSQRNTGVSS